MRGSTALTETIAVQEHVERLPTKEKAVLKGHEGPVFVVKYNRTGQYCLTGGKDRTIR